MLKKFCFEKGKFKEISFKIFVTFVYILYIETFAKNHLFDFSSEQVNFIGPIFKV